MNHCGVYCMAQSIEFLNVNYQINDEKAEKNNNIQAFSVPVYHLINKHTRFSQLQTSVSIVQSKCPSKCTKLIYYIVTFTLIYTDFIIVIRSVFFFTRKFKEIYLLCMQFIRNTKHNMRYAIYVVRCRLIQFRTVKTVSNQSYPLL